MIDYIILDLAIIAETKEIMKDKFPTMVKYFLEDAETYINVIRDGIAASIIEKIVLPAHTLKSSSHQMGAMRLSELAKEVEKLSRVQVSCENHDIQIFRELLEKLEAAFVETKSAYEKQSHCS